MVMAGSLLEIKRLRLTSRSGAWAAPIRKEERSRAPRPNSVRFMDVRRTAPATGCKRTQLDRPVQSNTAATARVTTTSVVMRLNRDLMEGFMAAPRMMLDDDRESARTACADVVESVTPETDRCH